MKLSYVNFGIPTLFTMRSKVDPRPDYQRPLAWSNKQKQLLIDSIIRGYDIPKMYWERLSAEGQYKYAVIDGQQRITTLWGFYGNEFSLARDAEPVNGTNIAGKKFSELDEDIQESINAYQVNVVIVEEAIQNDDEDEIREMFLRLQNGTSLKAQEKRNAEPGKMRDFVKEIARHPFFENCKFSNTRLTFDHIAAQMVCLEIAGEPTSVRDSNLTSMYKVHRDFDTTSKIAKKVQKVLNFLNTAFPEKTPELERYNVITLYSLCSTLVEKYALAGVADSLRNWFINFERDRRDDDHKDEEDRDPQLIEYKRLTSYSTDGEESIRARLEFWEKRFFLDFPDIRPLDPQRSFSHEQRLSIYRRDQGKCQLKLKCNGSEKLAWENWHADHITPFSKGGQTTVSNGQISCSACNQSKGNSL
ncbi:DUF262 domain-containing protein [Rhodobacteraceae bacterium]|nr:DUF262 domain-containing protein [Paracoccaceae bacterium]